MKFGKPYILCLLALGSTLLFACRSTKEGGNASAKLEPSKELFIYGHYDEAFSLLKSDRSLLRKSADAQLLGAYCLYHLNRLSEAQSLITPLLNKEKTPMPDAWFLQARIYHAQHQFDRAAVFYKNYLKQLDGNHPHREMVQDEIQYCANGLEHIYKAPFCFAENLGAAVNTRYDEYAPVLNPIQPNRLFFSAARTESVGGLLDTRGRPDQRFGHYTGDIFQIRKTTEGWQAPTALPYSINSNQHEVIHAIKPDGRVLYFSKGVYSLKGQLFTDTSFNSQNNQGITANPITLPLSGERGDQYLYVVNDTLVVFASNRPGGMGGYDVYRCVYSQGVWQTPENMGAPINTPYDEISPFLCRDLQTWYYSSNNPLYSVGGFDVVKTAFNPYAKLWFPVQSAGMPINSAGDDTHFRLNDDGLGAFLASSRKDGYGQRDIYQVVYRDFQPEQEAPFTPVVQYKPTKPAADVVKALDTLQLIKDSKAQFTDLLIAYTVSIPSAGSIALDTEMNKALASSKANGTPSLVRIMTRQPKNESNWHGSNLEDVSLFTPDADRGLTFRVQIAASSKSNLSISGMEKYDLAIEKTPDMALFRYLVGRYKVPGEAKVIQREIQAKGIAKDAFIVPYLDGFRIPTQKIEALSRTYPLLKEIK